MVEHPLSVRKAVGSIPTFSTAVHAETFFTRCITTTRGNLLNLPVIVEEWIKGKKIIEFLLKVFRM